MNNNLKPLIAFLSISYLALLYFDTNKINYLENELKARDNAIIELSNITDSLESENTQLKSTIIEYIKKTEPSIQKTPNTDPEYKPAKFTI